MMLMIVLLAGFFFLYVVRGILFPFFMAAVIAYLVNPLIEKLLTRGFTRIGAIVLLFSMLLTICLIFGIFGLPMIMDELNRLSESFPTYVQGLQEKVDDFYVDIQRVKLPSIVKQVVDQSLQRAEEIGVDFLNRLTGIIFSLLSHMLSLVMAPIIAFYVLKDLEVISESINSWIPVVYWDDVYRLWLEINSVLSGFLRGQFLVAIFIAILTTIGLTILKVNFAVVLGILAGAFNVIPYVGPILGAIPAVVIVLIKSPIKAVAVIALSFVIQQIEGGFISPRIIGEKVGLHPTTVIFAVLAGGQLGGIVGMILAVPIAGVVKVILRFIFDKIPDPE